MGGGRQPMQVPSGGQYGERQALEQMQQGAPMAASPGGDVGAPQGAGDLMSQVVGFGEPSQMQDTPVTAGAALGDGPGMEALDLPNQPDEDMMRLIGWIPAFEHMANQPGSSKAARNLVRTLKGMS
ncbi:hypothetical protein AB0942_33240 [Streptomyces nodosus]|uniref:hypothetical protein n=1 Tax=Streptomyces nodosus TaxID=40318 RepID=UPI003451305A